MSGFVVVVVLPIVCVLMEIDVWMDGLVVGTFGGYVWWVRLVGTFGGFFFRSWFADVVCGFALLSKHGPMHRASNRLPIRHSDPINLHAVTCCPQACAHRARNKALSHDIFDVLILHLFILYYA